MICTPHKYYSGDQNKAYEMGAACGRFEGEQEQIQGFGGKTWKKKTIWKTQI
jgi:hypothetical protein